MNATTSSVLPLTTLAFLLKPKQWVDYFGFENAMQILEASRIAKCRREVLLLNTELTPVGYDSMGAPLYPHQLPIDAGVGHHLPRTGKQGSTRKAVTT